MVVGIDLGTTNTVVCYYQDADPQYLSFRKGYGNRATMLPSVIYVDEMNPKPDGSPTILVGKEALDKEEAVPGYLIRSSKRNMGVQGFSYPNSEEKHLFKTKILPKDVAYYILREVRTELIEQNQLPKDEIISAVITHPAYFSPLAVEETLESAKRAGFHIIQKMKEPHAVVHAHLESYDCRKSYIFVVDFGGGTLDLTLFCNHYSNSGTTDTKWSNIENGGHHEFGGDDINKCILKWLLVQILNECGVNLQNPQTAGIGKAEYNRIMWSIYHKAIEMKERFGNIIATASNIDLNYELSNGKRISLKCEFSKDDFNQCCQKIYSDFSGYLDKTIADARKEFPEFNPKSNDILVLLAGGSCQIPQIQEITKSKFPSAEIRREDLARAIAHGAVFASTIVKTIDKLVFEWGVDVIDENGQAVFQPMLTREDVPPCEKSVTFKPSVAKADNVIVNIFSRDALNVPIADKRLSQCQRWGRIIIKNSSQSRGTTPKIKITFNYYEDGTVKIMGQNIAENLPPQELKVDINQNYVSGNAPIVPIDKFNVFLLVDVSGSMDSAVDGGRSKRIIEVKKAIRALVNEIIDMNRCEVGVYTFGTDANCIVDLTKDKKKICRRVETIEANAGGTLCSEAIYLSYQNLLRNRKNGYIPVIILLTDGKISTPEDREKSIINAQNAQQSGIHVASIGISMNPTDIQTLESLSSLNASNQRMAYGLNDIYKLKDLFGDIFASLA